MVSLTQQTYLSLSTTQDNQENLADILFTTPNEEEIVELEAILDYIEVVEEDNTQAVKKVMSELCVITVINTVIQVQPAAWDLDTNEMEW